MKLLTDTYKKTGTLHHAYAFEGNKAVIMPDLLKFFTKDFGIELKNNPDFSYQEFETFTIDDGRALQELHRRRAIAGKKIFVISTRFVTSEAQNSLLKIFEEPGEGAHFFLIMPNTQVLIPTLRSRLVIVNHDVLDRDSLRDVGTVGNSEAITLAKRFILAGAAERLVVVKNIVEEKDKGKAIDFVTALEEMLAPRLKSSPKENAGVLAEILTVKKYLHDRAPSVKLLLEHLCLFVTIARP